MKRWPWLLLFLVASVASADLVTTFAWNNGANWPSGTTVELCANDLCVPGLTGAQHEMTVPVQPGGVISAKARAVTPSGYQCGSPPIPCPYSEWATLAQTWPNTPTNGWARYEIQEVPTMAAPTFVAQYATVFNTTTSPKTAMSAVAINSGDVLIGLVARESGNLGIVPGLTENGAAAWVDQRVSPLIDDQWVAVRASSYVATANETLTVTITSSGSAVFGGNVVRFSGSDGVGESNVANGATGSPSVSLTTTQANSAIVVIVGDWNAVSGTQTFTNNFSGTPTALTDSPGDGNQYGVAIAYFPDAGAAGSKTVGMSAPTGQKWTIIAIEVKGTAGGGSASLPPNILNQNYAHILVR